MFIHHVSPRSVTAHLIADVGHIADRLHGSLHTSMAALRPNRPSHPVRGESYYDASLTDRELYRL